jgi:DNA polymerase III subunit alpha, Gram-positive type
MSNQSPTSAPLVYFDLETTGLNCYHHRIIEVCGQRENITSSENTPIPYHNLCHLNGSPLPDKITEITGITEDMLSDAPSEKQVLREFRDFCGRTKAPMYLIAHNCEGFDKWFIRSRCFAYGLRIPSNWKYLDTILLAKLLHPEFHSYSLASLCKHYQIVQVSAHRADDDVNCLRQLFHRLIDEYQVKYGITGSKFSHEILESVWKTTNFKIKLKNKHKHKHKI